MKKSISKFLLCILFFFAAAVLAANTPLQVIKDSNSDALRIQQGKSSLDAATEAQLRQVINRVTSFSIMSARVMEWLPPLNPAQKNLFDNRFQELLRVSSVKKAGRYRAKGFQYLGVRMAGADAVVRTIALYKTDRVALDYTLKNFGGTWKIVDYNIDGIGTVDNYRKMFRILFKRKDFNGVIETINNSIKRYNADK
jgi:ABC-type transporter MlaC component